MGSQKSRKERRAKKVVNMWKDRPQTGRRYCYMYNWQGTISNQNIEKVPVNQYEKIQPNRTVVAQTFWSQDPMLHLKITRESRELLFVWVVSTDKY